MTGLKVTASIDSVPTVRLSDDAVAAWLRGRLNDGRNVFIKHMQRGGGGGRVYRRGNRWHRASAPGEYPVTDRGRLVQHVDYQISGPHEGQLYSDLDYAEYLAFGTRRGLEPRAMLAEALVEVLHARPNTDELARCVVVTTEPPHHGE